MSQKSLDVSLKSMFSAKSNHFDKSLEEVKEDEEIFG